MTTKEQRDALRLLLDNLADAERAEAAGIYGVADQTAAHAADARQALADEITPALIDALLVEADTRDTEVAELRACLRLAIAAWREADWHWVGEYNHVCEDVADHDVVDDHYVRCLSALRETEST